nr:MAG TPA: hypothetical protein [Caudoviricetes sp.]
MVDLRGQKASKRVKIGLKSRIRGGLFHNMCRVFGKEIERKYLIYSNISLSLYA